MMTTIFYRPDSIIDPEPTKTTIEQCEINVTKFFSDDQYRNIILQETNRILHLDDSLIQDYKAIKPNTLQYQVVHIKMKDNAIDNQKSIDQTLDQSILGIAICISIEDTFCPLILQYDNSITTINHEAIHIHQSLKDSYYPLDKQLTDIDKKLVNPSLVVPHILNTLGVEKAIEYAVRKPCVQLRQEAEAWWKIDKNNGVGPEIYFLSYAIPSIAKFACAIINDIKLSTKHDQFKELVEIVSKYIEFTGEKDYYCKRVVELSNRKFKKSYSFGKWITECADVRFNTESNNLKELIMLICDCL